MHEDLKIKGLAIRAFVSFEARNGYLLTETPKGSITRLLKAFARLVPGIAEVACAPTSLHSQKQRVIAKETIELVEEITNYFDTSEDAGIISESRDLKTRCTASRGRIEEAIRQVAARLMCLRSPMLPAFLSMAPPRKPIHQRESPPIQIASLELAATSVRVVGIADKGDPSLKAKIRAVGPDCCHSPRVLSLALSRRSWSRASEQVPAARAIAGSI